MRDKRGDAPSIAFAVFLVFLAIVALVETRGLSAGTAADMGPGYVPRALACIILGFGLTLGIGGLLAPHRPLPSSKLRPILVVLLSLAVFATLLARGGLVIATLATLACATCATSDYKWHESAIFAIILTVFTVLLFVNALGLPLSVWPRW